MLRSLLRNGMRRAPRYPSPASRKLHLGCGRTLLKGWVNLDAVQLDGVDVVANLDDCRRIPLPFADDSFEEFLAVHVIEHLRDPLPFMLTMPAKRYAGKTPEELLEEVRVARNCVTEMYVDLRAVKPARLPEDPPGPASHVEFKLV